MLVLTVRKGSQTLETLELGPGAHTVGRQADCAVVLSDPSVSSLHARIEVGAREVVVKDMESLNGVYCDGRKVGKASFRRDVAFEIGGFTLSGTFKPEKTGKSLALPALPGFTVLVPAAFALAVLAALAAFWIGASSAVGEAARREALRRGAFLARSLAEMNATPLRAKITDLVRVTPVAAEGGVRYAYVADPYGKVLAPAEAIGRVLSNPKVAEAVQQGLTTLHQGAEGELVFVSPVKDAQGVLGVAVVGVLPGESSGVSLAVPGLMALAVGLAAALAGAWAARRSLLGPVRALAEEVDQALKTGKSSVDYRAPCPELEELCRSAEKLLLLAGSRPDNPAPCRARDEAPSGGGRPASSRPEPAPSRREPTASRPGDGQTSPGVPAPSAPVPDASVPDASALGAPDQGGQAPNAPAWGRNAPGAPAPNGAAPNAPSPDSAAPDHAAPAALDLESLAAPALLVDLADYRILAWNRAFEPLAAPGAAPPVHLLQGLADPERLSALLGLLEDPSGEARAPLAPGPDAAPASVSKRPAGEGRALFVFEEAPRG